MRQLPSLEDFLHKSLAKPATLESLKEETEKYLQQKKKPSENSYTVALLG